MLFTASSLLFIIALAAGGALGASKGSIESLYAASAVAGTLFVLELIVFSNARNVSKFSSSSDCANLGACLQIVVTFILAAVMYNRYTASGKIMPAGAVCAIAFVMFWIYSFRFVFQLRAPHMELTAKKG